MNHNIPKKVTNVNKFSEYFIYSVIENFIKLSLFIFVNFFQKKKNTISNDVFAYYFLDILVEFYLFYSSQVRNVEARNQGLHEQKDGNEKFLTPP